MKKFLAVILTVMLIISVCPLGAFNLTASALTSGYYTYSVSDGEATITDCDTSISGNVTIPSSLGGYLVTSIGSFAFRVCDSLTSVTIPKSVTSIGDYAFDDCTSLTLITIPDSVTSIGDYAFSDCSSLSSITIPDSVNSIGSSAFYNCYRLKSIKIPYGIENINAYTFSHCNALKEISIPETVKSIEAGAFTNCYRLKNIVIPYGVESICSSAFNECIGLTSIDLPKTVTYIEASAFDGCYDLKEVRYSGSEDDRYNIFVESNNGYFNNAVWIYNVGVQGDLNGDGTVNLLDLVKLKKILAGVDTSSSVPFDLDGDGDATAKDMTILMNLILGIVTDSNSNLEKISELSWGVIEETDYGYQYTLLDFKNNLFGNMIYSRRSDYSDLKFTFDGVFYEVNGVEAAVFPDSELDIKTCIDFEDNDFLIFYPYTKASSDTEYIKFQRLNKSELKVIENTAIAEFKNFTVGKILKLVTIEIL